MTKSEQQSAVLVIDPQNELMFKGPFTTPVVSYIKLTNLTDKDVFFKLKTTAPKKYCVRPNSGQLSTKEAVEVQVLLQPFAYNPADKHKHKFMVQYVVVENEGCNTTSDELWKCIAPDKIMNYKLKCVFEMPCIPGSELQPEFNTEAKSELPVVSDEKIRKYSENYKSAGKTMTMGNGSELEKVAAELKTLRDENNKLQEENLSLKDQVVRLRKLTSGTDRHAYLPPAAQHGMYNEEDRMYRGTMPMYYIVIAVLIATFSFIFGKFV